MMMNHPIRRRWWIDVKSISCKGVKSSNLFQIQKPTIYAVVSLLDSSSTDKRQQEQKTPPDRAGGERPEWDHPMRFSLELLEGGNGNDLLLDFKLMAQASVLRDKLIGKATVPVSDLTPPDFDLTSGSGFRHVSYQVRTSDGKPNGVLTFAYKITSPHQGPHQNQNQNHGNVASVDSIYPPLLAPASAVDHYPPPPEEEGYYPAASPAVGFYPKLDQADIYPPPDPAVSYYAGASTMTRSGYNPPVLPPPPAQHVAYNYPPPTPMCCYPPPPPPDQQHSYRAGSWDRGLYGYN